MLMGEVGCPGTSGWWGGGGQKGGIKELCAFAPV